MHSGDASPLSVVASVEGSFGRTAARRSIEPSLGAIGDEARSSTAALDTRALKVQSGKATVHEGTNRCGVAVFLDGLSMRAPRMTRRQ